MIPIIERRPSQPDQTFKGLLRREAENLIIEATSFIGFLLLLALGSFLVKTFFGNSLLWGRVPKEWLFDGGDAGLIICFSIRSARRFLR